MNIIIDLFLYFDSLTAIVIHTILLLGIVGFVASYFVSKLPILPVVGQIDVTSKVLFGIAPIATILRVVSAALFLIGLYYEGGLAAKEKLDGDIRVLQHKVKIAEDDAIKLNEELLNKSEVKIVYIREKTKEVVQSIEQNKEQINKSCEVDSTAIKILNYAAKKQK